MAFKNYYKTLGLSPNASLADIKKRFRKLALQYHPDTNHGDSFAEIHFREIQEAYETLSDPDKRILYQQEWRLRNPGIDLNTAYTTTPALILSECTKLHQKVLQMDAFRMNKEQVYHLVNNILSEHNLALLQQEKEHDTNYKIISEVLRVASRLHYNQSNAIALLLKPLAGNNADILSKIDTFIQQSRKRNQWERYYPLLVLLITVVMSVLIYVVSR